MQRIRDAHRLRPHRVSSFERSTDPDFAERLEDIPSRTAKPSRPETQTHDGIRHGTTMLFAALDVLDGTVVGRRMRRHRPDAILRFLDTIWPRYRGKLIHVILDNNTKTLTPRRCGSAM